MAFRLTGRAYLSRPTTALRLTRQWKSRTIHSSVLCRKLTSQMDSTTEVDVYEDKYGNPYMLFQYEMTFEGWKPMKWCKDCPTLPAKDGAWQDQASCRGLDTDQFFEEDQADRLAQGVCALCPVRTDCLDYAIANDQPGLWGGVWFGNDPTARRAKARRIVRDDAR